MKPARQELPAGPNLLRLDRPRERAGRFRRTALKSRHPFQFANSFFQALMLAAHEAEDDAVADEQHGEGKESNASANDQPNVKCFHIGSFRYGRANTRNPTKGRA